MTEEQIQEKPDNIALKILWVLLAVAMNVFFGLSFVIGKKTLSYVKPFFLTGVRMLCAAVIILAAQWVIDRKKFYLPNKSMFMEMMLITVFNVFFTNCLEFWGLQYLSCYQTCYIYSLAPFFSAIISFFFLKERLGSMKIIGLVIALIGFIPLLVYKQIGASKQFYISSAEWALLGAAVSSVIGWISVRKISHQKKYPFLMANGLSMLYGGILSLLLSFAFEGFFPLPVVKWGPFLQGMLIITLINNIIGYSLAGFLVGKFTVTLMTFIGFITPLITALFGWIFLQETVSLLFFISYVVVFIGFVFFSREELIYNVR